MTLFRRASDGSRLKFHFLEFTDAELKDIEELVTVNGGTVGEYTELPVRFVQRHKYKDGMYPLFRLYDVEFIRMCIRKRKLVKLQPFRLGPKKLADHCIANSFVYGQCPYEKIVSSVRIQGSPVIFDSSYASDNDSDVEMNSNGIDKSSDSPDHPSPKKARLSVDESQSVVANAYVRRRLVDTSKFESSPTVALTSKNNPKDSSSNTVDATIAEMRKMSNEDRDQRTIEPPLENKSSKNVFDNRVIASQISEYDTAMDQIDIKEEFPETLDWDEDAQILLSSESAETPLTRPSCASPEDRPSPNVTPSLPDFPSANPERPPIIVPRDCVSPSNEAQTIAESPETPPRPIVKSFVRSNPDNSIEPQKKCIKISTKNDWVTVRKSIDVNNFSDKFMRGDGTAVPLLRTNVRYRDLPTTSNQSTIVLNPKYRGDHAKMWKTIEKRKFDYHENRKTRRVVRKISSSSDEIENPDSDTDCDDEVVRKAMTNVRRRNFDATNADKKNTYDDETSEEKSEEEHENLETELVDCQRVIVGKSRKRGSGANTAQLWRARLDSERPNNIKITRMKFTRTEQREMIDYLLTFKDIPKCCPKGLTVWRDMIEQGILKYRTPQSLQNNFVKKLLPNIEDFFDRMNEQQRKQFRFLQGPSYRRKLPD